MMEDHERGSADWSPWDDERRILVNIIRKQTEHGGGGNYTENGGEKTLLKWLLGISASLLVVSVVGGVGLYGEVAAIKANQSSQADQANRMQGQIDRLADSVQTLTRRP